MAEASQTPLCPEDTHQVEVKPFPEAEAMKAARLEKAHIYAKTRRAMSAKTKKMFVFGLRNYQRHGHVPTKRTRPTMLKRRYSVDVNTEGWDQPVTSGFVEGQNQQAANGTTTALPSFSQPHHDELELVTPITSKLPFPTPHRYTDFNKWIAWDPPANDDCYLELRTAEISNNEFLYITHTCGPEQWMRDNGLDMALMVLSCNKHCEASKIGIASSIDSQVCRYPGSDGKEDYARRFGDKNWIFMPVNDGMLGVENDGINGIHWSVVALDQIHKTVHYFDSLFIDDLSYINLAKEVSLGMLRLLGRDPEEWQFQTEEHSPNQYRDNLCDFDGGACAPFVYNIIGIVTSHIQRHQRIGREDECRLNLLEDFHEGFRRQFHSYEVRTVMQQSIAHAKMYVTADTVSHAHDTSTIAGEGVELVDEPPLRFNAPLQLVQPQPSETDSDTESNSGSAMYLVEAPPEEDLPVVDI